MKPTTLTGNVTLDVVAGGSKIEVRDEQGNPISLPETYATPSDLPENVWVKGVRASSTPRDITLELAYGIFRDRINITVFEVAIEPFDSVPPTQARSVEVTVIPSLSPGNTIELDVIRTAGTSGSATVTPSSITGTTTVTVTAGQQTSVGSADNLSLRAKLDSSCICDSETFSVCAHPEDFEATFCDAVLFWNYYGLEVSSYTWESDSGTVAHLDQCYGIESFSYPHDDTPPFYNVGAPEPDDFVMSDGTENDCQGYLKTDVRNYTDGDAGWDQTIYFLCFRCSGHDTLTNNTTTFTVYDKPDGSGDWWIDTEVSMSCPGPPGGCIVEENIP